MVVKRNGRLFFGDGSSENGMAEKSGGRNRRCCRNRSRPLGAGCRLRRERQCGGRIPAQAEKTLAEVSSGGYERQEAVSCSGSGTEESRRQTIARSAAASPVPKSKRSAETNLAGTSPANPKRP